MLSYFTASTYKEEVKKDTLTDLFKVFQYELNKNNIKSTLFSSYIQFEKDNDKWILYVLPKWKQEINVVDSTTSSQVKLDFGVNELYYPSRNKIEDLIRWFRTNNVNVKLFLDLEKKYNNYIEFTFNGKILSLYIDTKLEITPYPVSMQFKLLL